MVMFDDHGFFGPWESTAWGKNSSEEDDDFNWIPAIVIVAVAILTLWMMWHFCGTHQSFCDAI